MAGAVKYEDDNEDVPPLEDMTDVLESFSKLTSNEISTKGETRKFNPFLEVKGSSLETENAKRIEKLLGKPSNQEHKESKNNADRSVSKQEAGKPPTFGGFKKGFLLGRKETPSSKNAKEKETNQGKKIEELKPKAKNERDNPLVFSEVQDAMSAQMPLLQSKDWITEDLLSKVKNNPKLFKQLQDPEFSQALAAFQSNPQQAMVAFQSKPELQEFIRDFCAIMGEHFSALGETDASSKSDKPKDVLKASTSKSIQSNTTMPQSQSDDDKMKEILSNPDIQKILAKPKIQNLISAMKNDPESSGRMLAEFGPEEHRDIQRLVEVGLLGISKR